MEDFFSSLINILKTTYDSIAKFAISAVLWIIDFIKNFLLDTGITNDVSTATVIAVIIIFIIFLLAAGCFFGILQGRVGGSNDSYDN